MTPLARIFTHAERPDLRERLEEIGNPWPEFMLHGQVTNRYWADLYERFPACQLVLYDAGADVLLGKGNTIPVTWDGSVPGLLAGVDEALTHGIRLHEQGQQPTTLCALVATVAPGYRGRGLSMHLINGMREVALRQQLGCLLAPVRPTLKDAYPDTPFEDYVGRRREDGTRFDPWIRLHERLGGEILTVCPQSCVVEGTIAEWEHWTHRTFPESGDYQIEGGLAPVDIDLQHDRGRYAEPNLWMRHKVR